MYRIMYLFTIGLYQVPIKTEEKQAADITFIATQFVRNKDLLTLLRGDPPHNIQLDINQLALV